jgi:hypothetical protein
LSGKTGGDETLRNFEKERGDSGSIFGDGNICNKVHNGDALLMGKLRQNLHEVNGDHGQNKECGGSASIYMFQWDSIKEKMM